MKGLYNAQYYAKSCGKPYRRDDVWLGFFAGIADRIVEDIRPRTVLDVGCAMGFLVESLRDRGVEAFGIDISAFALGEVREDIRPFCTLASAEQDFGRDFDLIVCIEVVEHIEKDMAKHVIANICRHTTDVLFSSTPSDFKEPTHVNVQPIDYWVRLFAEHGFYRDLEYDATFIAPHACRFRRMQDAYPRQFASYERHLQRLSAEVQAQREKLLELRGEVDQVEVLRQAQANTDVALRSSGFQIAAWRRRSAVLATRVRRLEEELSRREKTIATLSGQLAAVQQSLSWRATAVLRWARSVQLGLSGRTTLIPESGLSAAGKDVWECTSREPWFTVLGQIHGGWVEIRYRVEAEDVALRASLSLDTGHGFDVAERIPLPEPVRGVVRHLVRLPDGVVGLRLSPCSGQGRIRLSDCRVRHLPKGWAAVQLLVEASSAVGTSAVLRRLLRSWRSGGLWRVRRTLFDLYQDQLPLRVGGRDPLYQRWIEAFDTLTEDDEQQIRRHIEQLERTPKISVLMPVYNIDERWLRSAIESVLRQIYPFWELCIVDDASTAPHVRRVLSEYAKRDERIKVRFREQNGHIAIASNDALAMADGTYIGLLDHDDELAPHALYAVAVEVNEHPDALIIYTDEDKIDEKGLRCDPYFKPDWSPDLFFGQNMVCHFGVYRTDVVKDIGGFRSGFDGSQDYDLTLRVMERCAPDQIRHIPAVLYHWRMVEGSVASGPGNKAYAYAAARRALQEYFDRNAIPASSVECPFTPVFHRAVFRLPQGSEPKVSVIILTKDRVELLRKAVATVLSSGDGNIELIVVDNGSREGTTLDYLRQIEGDFANVIRVDGSFNYARLNNLAAAKANGELLLLLNNDVETDEAGWLVEMVTHALRPEVGVVGAALFYPDGTWQHGGVILGAGGVAGHVHVGHAAGEPGYFGRLWLTHNLSAVTGACMMVRREVFSAVGGMTEELGVALNDIDFCLKVRRLGLLVVWTPHARLVHHESASRGYDTTPRKRRRLERERQWMVEHWGDVLNHDPYYNPNLTLDGPLFTLAWPPRGEKPWRRFRMLGDELGNGPRNARRFRHGSTGQPTP